MNLVFASGVLVPQHLLHLDYFRAISEAFPGSLFSQTPVTAGIEARADALAEQIDQAFPAGPIHVVAHSMGGGLDTRCMLSKDLRGLASGGRVVSLSTISTPHRGSPIADLLVGPAPDGDGIRPFVYKLLRHAFDELGLSLDALGDLTTGGTRRIQREPFQQCRTSYIVHTLARALNRSRSRVPTCIWKRSANPMTPARMTVS
jgi:triacylglycerol esterase/lipase EstA (alpha/beta hydrolase family)